MRATVPILVFLLAFGATEFVIAADGTGADAHAAKPDVSVVDDVESAKRGYRLLTETALLPTDFDQGVFDALWQAWPGPIRKIAENATATERRDMAYKRYGLTPRPDNEDKPLQYVVSKDGSWTINCFGCHGGNVDGRPVPGAPNNRFALQTLTEEVRATKFKQGKTLAHLDLGSYVIPLGTTNGTTNAVVFGMALLNQRDDDLNLVNRAPRTFTNHDMDAPPWWHFHKRPSIYIDGFAKKSHRGLMQFMLAPENGPDFFRDHEDDFRDVFAYLSSLRAPKFDGPIESSRVKTGLEVFNRSCAECHGTYGESWTYPNRRVPLDVIGTDPARLRALSVAGRRRYAESWFAGEDGEATIVDPDGYVAPPLDGIWASAPYFHNGSVPTLWHVLHPEERPVIWRPTSQRIDREKMGLQFVEAEKVPLDQPDAALRRSYFDTRRFGKSRGGHDFVDELSEDEKVAVLEYLKTL